MKTLRTRTSTTLSAQRWTSYVAAGAATALAGASSAEGAIHYSGRIHEVFDAPLHSTQFGEFDLQGGARLAFEFAREDSGRGDAFFDIRGAVFADSLSQSFRGFVSNGHAYPERLSFGDLVSGGAFTPGSVGPSGVLARHGFPNGQWKERGIGYVGFRFDLGNGTQFGWARVRMFGTPDNHFILIDYAWADPGESIKAGAKEHVSELPAKGSLGMLALGGAALLAWRKRRGASAQNR